MKSADIMYSAGGNDECMTPRYAVEPIVKYIPRGARVWCPFDQVSSEFPSVLHKAGFDVTISHIADGQDYYVYEPARWDVLVSNPPFTNKRKIFERALSFGKPFALLMSNTWLNDAAPKQLWRDIDLQLLMFDKRITYGQGKKITFSSSYYCRGLLPKQIIMESL